MTDRLPLLLLAGPAAAFVLSAVLLVIALRGRRVDDHPICRKCGFDLFGKSEGVTVCSECGADLTRPRAVRVGRREKRRRLIQLAAPVMVVCVAWLGLLGWGAVRGTDWNKHKPAWWLMRDARSADAATRDAALGELVQRVLDGKLSQQSVDALVDLALEVQGDPSKPWADGWGEAVGAARAAGKLAPEKWQRYARQGVEVRLETRPTLRRGDPLVFAYVPAGPRLARRHVFHVTYDPEPVRAGERPLTWYASPLAAKVDQTRRRPLTTPVQAGWSYHVSTRSVSVDPKVLGALADGPQTLRSTIRLKVADAGGTPGDLVDEKVELTAPFTLFPATAQTIKLRTDPELKAAVENAFAIDRLMLDEIGSPPNVQGTLIVTKTPVPVAFRVYARAGDREWSLGTVVDLRARGTSAYTVRANFSDRGSASAHRSYISDWLRDAPRVDLKPGASVDLVLKPDTNLAIGTVHLTEIWGGEVVLKGVPVLASTPPAPPEPVTRPAGPTTR